MARSDRASARRKSVKRDGQTRGRAPTDDSAAATPQLPAAAGDRPGLDAMALAQILDEQKAMRSAIDEIREMLRRLLEKPGRRSRSKAAAARLMTERGLASRLVPACVAAIIVNRSETEFLRLVKLKLAPQPVSKFGPESKVQEWDVRDLDRFLDADSPQVHTDPKAVREQIRAERLAAKAHHAKGQQEDRS